jgi:Cu-Zn family superoxide dismutase
VIRPPPAAWLIALVLSLVGCRMPYIPNPYVPIPFMSTPPPSAAAHLKDGSGRVVGTAVLLEDGGEVRLLLDVSGLPPGDKAVHIHEVGRCDPPSFDSAGGHFNPTGAEHGTANPRGPHVGDLPNMTVDASGRGHLEVTIKRVSLEKGSGSLFDADGSALVVHANADDMRTNPAGNSGAPIACGVIERGN